MIIKVFKILCLIIGAAIVLLGGLVVSAGEASAGTFMIVFGVLFFWFAFLLNKRGTRKAGNKMKRSAPEPDSAKNPLKFEIYGLFNRVEDFIALADENKNYKLPDEEFLEKYSSGRPVYRYWFNNIHMVELVPEPDNPKDPNAIKVVLEGVHVGYVPRDLCIAVAEKLQEGYRPRVKASGGPYKYAKNGRVNQSRKEYEITIELRKPDAG